MHLHALLVNLLAMIEHWTTKVNLLNFVSGVQATTSINTSINICLIKTVCAL